MYTPTLFLGAFLLFQVQPMLARYILPWYGGSAAVWSTCLLFFQVALLAGYGYVHLLTRHLTPRRQVAVHLFLLATALTLLPVTPDSAFKPAADTSPLFGIMLLLTLNVGGPYLLLSASAPLLQHWSARLHGGEPPYHFYAISNFGSLLGLWTYPIIIEPRLPLSSQTMTWSVAFAAYAFLCAACAVPIYRMERKSVADASPPSSEPRISMRRWAMWLLLPTCGSVLLLSGTHRVSQDIAVIPLLWIAPLSVYLISFIIVFARPSWYRRVPWAAAFLAALAALESIEWNDARIAQQLLLYSAAILSGCMICHGELGRLRPRTYHLTAFYLALAFGGACGGLVVSVIAPSWFNGYWEFHLALIGTWVLLGICMLYDPDLRVTRLRALPWAAALVTLVVFVEADIRDYFDEVIHARRSFFAALRVFDVDVGTRDNKRELVHGTTVHSAQFVNADRRREPIEYYGVNSGVGATLRTQRWILGRRLRVGAVGLGAGTIAAHSLPGEVFRFYEIDDAVLAVAREYFTYLDDARGEIEIAMGDARISLERELREHGPQKFDVLVLDAFSGSGTPVHLLTREAFILYFQHLSSAGVVAVNVSNWHLNLRGVLRRQAQEIGAGVVRVRHRRHMRPGEDRNEWIIITSSDAFLNGIKTHVDPWTPNEKLGSLWTDDYSNVIEVIER